MNDFTKDELNTLQDCIWHVLHCNKMHISCEEEKEMDIIMSKISTMIDNCCAHSWSTISTVDNFLIACCEKCGAFSQ